MCRRSPSRHVARFILTAVSACAVCGCLSKSDGHVKCTLDEPSVSDSVRHYLQYLPPGYRVEQRRWPLVLFLHGAGEVGDEVELVKQQGLPQRVANGWCPPFVLVSPQTRTPPWNSDDLIALFDQIQQDLDIDADRVYVTGLSLGGAGTWALAAAHPDRFAAAVPICGYGDPETAGQLRSLPIRVYHGGKDDAVPLVCSQEMVDAVSALNGNVQFTVYPEAEHDCWTQAYASAELYDWMLSQRRPKQQDMEK